MIVRTSDHVWHLITQPDHAALARRIMERFVPLHDVERRASILLAVEEHDNGWRELDAAPTVNPANGQIFDFVSRTTPTGGKDFSFISQIFMAAGNFGGSVPNTAPSPFLR